MWAIVLALGQLNEPSIGQSKSLTGLYPRTKLVLELVNHCKWFGWGHIPEAQPIEVGPGMGMGLAGHSQDGKHIIGTL
jgi:hypothetical protein